LVEQLIEVGQSVFAVQSGEQFSKPNAQTFRVRPQNSRDYAKLLQQLRGIGALPKTIVYCWGMNAPGSSELDLEHFQVYVQESIYSLLRLVRAFGQEASNDDVQLLLVSDQGHKVTGQEEYHPYQAMFPSIATVITQEYLTLACHCVDLDLRDPHGKAQSVQQLLETLVAPSEPLIAYRDRERWGLRFDPVHLGALASSPLRTRGVYLITGGLGHIGLVLAEHLAKQVQARLILVARSMVPPKSEWNNWLLTQSDPTSQKIMRLQQIERAGAEIFLVQADVADEHAMTAVLHQVDERFGTLHGVIHAAGITSEQAFRPIEEIGTQPWQWHFHPKVHGVLTLEKVLRGRTLDFCVLFSSLSTVLGGLGFVAYAAANACMEAMISHYNNASIFPWIGIDWDTWQFAQEKQQAALLGRTVSMYAMTPDEGIEALQRILDAKAELQQVVISTGSLEARINQWVKMETIHERGRGSARHLPTLSPAQSTRPALANAYVAPDNEVQQAIESLWEECLGIEGIGIHDNFFALGGHSLVGTQLISRIRRQFGINLPMAALFESPTIAELALMVELALIEEIEQLDDVRL
jgi:acyl carrier protein